MSGGQIHGDERGIGSGWWAHSATHIDDVLENCSPETYIILLTIVIPTNLMNKFFLNFIFWNEILREVYAYLNLFIFLYILEYKHWCEISELNISYHFNGLFIKEMSKSIVSRLKALVPGTRHDKRACLCRV